MSEKVLITDIIRKEDTNYLPILVDFQNGNLNEGYGSKSNFIVANNKNTKEHEGIFSINKNIYHGTFRENEEDLTKTFIAVKRGNKVRLIEVNKCTLSHDVHSQQTDSLGRFNNKELAIRALLKNFGSKKSKIYLERTERSKVNLDIIKTQLNKTLDATALQEDDDYKVCELEIIPPFNKDATNVSEVYNLTNILEEDFLHSLEQEAISVNDYNNELPITSEFLLKEINRVKEIKSKKECFTLLKVLIYLDGLLNYIKIKRRNVDGVELSKISDKISDDIRRRFSPKESIKPIKTSTSTDKAICYFIVLIMLIQPNLELDINILTTEIGRPKRKIKSACNILHIKQKQYSDILIFSLPSNAAKGNIKANRPLNRKTL